MSDTEKDNESDRGYRAGRIRESDVEPYTGLRWVSTLFKAASVFVLVAMLAEFIAGFRIEGAGALPILLGESVRTAVVAMVLWGMGDLVRLLVDVGHDVRAQRILLTRVASRLRSEAKARAGAGSDGDELDPDDSDHDGYLEEEEAEEPREAGDGRRSGTQARDPASVQ